MSATSKFDRKRGRHKKRASVETKVWEEEHLIPVRPSWMDAETYQQLAELRECRDSDTSATLAEQPIEGGHHVTE